MAKFNIEAMKTLARHAVNGTVPTNFEKVATVEDVKETLREACKELAPDIYSYERNKTYIFEIIQTAMDEVLPKKVLATVGQFAEVRQFGLGQKHRFEIKTGRNRAKQFVSRVAAEGIYETFRLDRKYIELEVHTYGGAAAIDIERYLMGEEDFVEYTQIMMEGLEEAIYKEIWKLLINSAKQLTAYNNFAEVDGSGTVYGAAEQQAILKLCSTVKKYGAGTGAVIIAPEEINQKFINDVNSGFTPNVAQSDIEEIKQTGLVGRWRGNDIVTLPNSFTDENNNELVLENYVGFVFPTGSSQKVVKVGIEGPTFVDDYKNKDRSMEIQAYKRFGVAIITYNDWCMFEDKTLKAAWNKD